MVNRPDIPRRRAASVAALIAASVAPVLVAAIAFALVRRAMLPGVAFWDTGEFQTVAPVLGTAHPTGYPTFVILGWLASLLLTPFGEPAFRINLFAGLCVAAAAGLTVVLVRKLTGSTPIAVAVGIGLAATPLAWGIGTHADPHALHLAFVALLLALLVGWEQAHDRGRPHANRWLIATAVAFGLSDGNHSLTLLLALPVGLYVLSVDPGILRRPRLIATCVAALFGTIALVYLELPIRAGILRAPLVYANPSTWDGFWYIALAEQFRGALSDPFADLPRKIGDLGGIASMQFGGLAALIPAGFIATIWRNPRYAFLTGLGALITCGFAAAYTNADITRYYLGPVLMAWTWIGVLAMVAVEILVGLVAPTRPPFVAPGYAPIVQRGLALVMAVLILAPTVGAVPARAARVDVSSDRSAQVWLDAALPAFDPDAVVVSWWSYSTPLWYAQRVEGLRPDVMIVDDRTLLDLGYTDVLQVIAAYVGRRPVYLIRQTTGDVAHVAAKFQLAPLNAGAASNVYQILGPIAAGS